MARPKLSSPSQPLPLRLLLMTYEFFASLKLAVLLIFSLALVLGWATFVESLDGTRAVHFGIYGTWWFAGLQFLLAVNIFCAASIRFPWQRHQTGFVITHIGLLTLLFGCWLSRQYGIDAQMLVPEGSNSAIAFEDRQHFELAIHRGSDHGHTDGHDHAVGDERGVEVISIPFRGGPFNWSDFEERSSIPWSWAHRDQGVIFDEDGIRLEVLDYNANSKVVNAPEVKLELSMPAGMPGQAAKNGKTRWMPVELNVRQARDTRRSGYPYGLGASQRVGGGQISFWLVGTESGTQAFLDSAPSGEIGPKGQVVLHAKGQRFEIDVEEQLSGDPIPLGDSGLSARVVDQFNLPDQPPPNQPGVELEIISDEQGAQFERVILLAGLPELNKYDYKNDVYGTYWVSTADQKSEDLVRGEGGSRIDVIQGHDGRLYYRYWNRKEVVAADVLPSDGTPVDAFKMPIGQLQLRTADHIARDRPEPVILPVKFNKDATAVDSYRAAKLRLTVDGNEEELWLLGAPPDLFGGAPSPLERRMVSGEGRVVSISMPLDVVDIGFRITLQPGGFERFLDPGTSQASHYGSVVDFLDRDRDESLREGLQISMNAPIDFTDPQRGRSYRLFQEAFRGPFRPGDGIYERIDQLSEKPLGGDQAYVTILTVNYDPGRGTKYLGCALIVAGIAVMFYMRAYFFKPAGKKTEPAKPAKRQAKPTAEPELVGS